MQRKCFRPLVVAAILLACQTVAFAREKSVPQYTAPSSGTTPASRSSAAPGWASYADAFPFSYSDTSVRTYTLLIPNAFGNGCARTPSGGFNEVFRISAGLSQFEGRYLELSSPVESAGYTTVRFRAYLEDDGGDYWLNFVDAVSIGGAVAFPVDDFAKLYEKDDNVFFYDEDESYWPEYLIGLYSSETNLDYYFVRSKADPYTIILWGVN